MTFPTQTLGKCGKMIPVLIWGSLFYQKGYTWRDYIVGFAIMLGCTLFLVTGVTIPPLPLPLPLPLTPLFIPLSLSFSSLSLSSFA